MKEKYEIPVCEVIMFYTEDVITTSGVVDGNLVGNGGCED